MAAAPVAAARAAAPTETFAEALADVPAKALASAGSFPLVQLQAQPFPVGVDPSKREAYVKDSVFESLFGMDRAAFAALPKWKQVAAKKKHKLF